MIHALPGMGADHRMYQGAWLTLPKFIAHDWVEYRGEKTLAEVAHSICEARSIQDGDTLIGSSLGGMVACEIARFKNISQLILVGSAIYRGEISHRWATLQRFMDVTPITFMQTLAGKMNGDIFQMFSAANASFIRAMCDAIFTWEGLQATSSRVHRIHGAHDWVIPLPEKVDLVLDGGHLIAMTHAKECVEYISRLI